MNLLIILGSIFILVAAFCFSDPTKKKNQSKVQKSGNVSEEVHFGLDCFYSPARVLRVIDGDTVKVRIAHADVTLRLSAIDSPESKQFWGDKATIGLIKMIGGRTVLVESHGVDPYNRTIATIYLEKPEGLENINEQMVMLGHAWVMRRYYKHLPVERQQQLNRLENWAKRKKIGLWNQDNPMPPWKWRKKQAVV